jgi:spermidine/putrescine transport system permease protein
MKRFNRVFTVLVLIFLYVPMIVLAVASFNSGMDISVWKGFTFSRYGELFRDGVLLPLLGIRLSSPLCLLSPQRSSAPWLPWGFTP